MGRYRVSISFNGLYLARILGTEGVDYCPPIRAYGLSGEQAVRRARQKADRLHRRTRVVEVDADA